MSGRGAPALTEAPRPARPNGVLVPSTILPFFIRAATCSGPLARISAEAFDCSFCSSEGPVSNVTVTLFLVAFSNPAATSKTPVDGPMVVMIQSSAAWLVPPAPATAKRPAAKALPQTFMVSSLVAAASPAADLSMQLNRSHSCEPVAFRRACARATGSHLMWGSRRVLAIAWLPGIQYLNPDISSIEYLKPQRHQIRRDSDDQSFKLAFARIGCIEFALFSESSDT